MNTTTITLSELIDNALFELEAAEESPLLTALSAAVADDSVTTFTYTGQDLIKTTDVVEVDQELMLVTGVSYADPTTTVTVSRGYYSTTAAAHASGAAVRINPTFPRRRVAEGINRSLTRIEALGIRLIVSTTVTRTAGKQFVELPAACREVLRVTYMNPDSGRFVEIPAWNLFQNVPTSVVTSGRALRIPWFVSDLDELIVEYATGHEWTGTFPQESATLTLHEAAVDLPSAYAAAWLVSNREVSRQEIDRGAEWSQSVQQRSGAPMVRLKWQEFYRTLDEAKRIVTLEVPKRRPRITRPSHFTP